MFANPSNAGPLSPNFVILKAFYPLVLTVLISSVRSAYIFTFNFTWSGIGHSWEHYILLLRVSVPMRYIDNNSLLLLFNTALRAFSYFLFNLKLQSL